MQPTKQVKGLRPTLVIPPTVKDGRKLFVGGLPVDVTHDEFREYFEQFGALIDSVVMFDHETNRSRGFGFVSFEDPQVATMLLAKGNEGKEIPVGGLPSGHLEMRGKIIEIKPAEPKESAYRKHRNNAKRLSQKFLGNPYTYAQVPYDVYYNMPAAIAYTSSYGALSCDYSPVAPMQVGMMYPVYPYVPASAYPMDAELMKQTAFDPAMYPVTHEISEHGDST